MFEVDVKNVTEQQQGRDGGGPAKVWGSDSKLHCYPVSYCCHGEWWKHKACDGEEGEGTSLFFLNMTKNEFWDTEGKQNEESLIHP